MNRSIEKLKEQIKTGRAGLNKGLPTGLPKLDSLTYGLIRENITLVGGSSGSGKSSLTTYIAVYNAYKEYLASGKTIDIHWLIFSLEMSESSLYSRILSMHLWDEYQLSVSHADIFSLENPLPDEVYDKVEASYEWLSGLADRCTIVPKASAKSLYGKVKTFAEQHGEFTVAASGQYNGEEWESLDYVPKNSQQYLVVVVDHVKLLETQSGHTSKQEIDEACKYLIYFRDKCKMSIYLVQQLNRNFQDMARRTEAGGAYQDIQLNDFSDTGDTVNASNTVLAIFFPYRERLSKWKEYWIDPRRNGLGDRCRTISLLKNRDGNADKFVGIAFYGESHIWMELPKPEEMDANSYATFQNLH